MASNDAPSTPPSPAPQAAPQIVIQQQASMFGRFGKLLLLALGIAVLVILGMFGSYQSYFQMSKEPPEKFHSLSKYATDKIAIIEISGPILDGEGFVKQQIDRVREDDAVKAVVLRINSPGGTITGSDYLYHHLKELADERELPLVVSMGSLCASGGYYIAMAVGDEPDTLFAEPTTWTGSIGVVIPHYDVSGLMRSFNIQDDSIASGQFKTMGSPTKPMTPEERALLEELVNESFTRFKQVILDGRPKFKENPQKLDELATGQIYTANQALQNGLIDKIGFLEAAIERAAELSGHSTDNLRCVQYKQHPTLFSTLSGEDARAPRGERSDLSTWLDLTAPRAYYLWTWLPTILSSSGR